MKTLWFKVENGPADEVEVKNAANIKQLKQEIIQQHSYLFPPPTGPALWHLFRTAEAEEPEDSGDNLQVLGDAGQTSRTALILKRVPAARSITNETLTALANQFKFLQLESSAKPASGFTASSSTVILNCGVNGVFPCTFNLPGIIKDAINSTPTEEELSSAVVAIEKGLLFTMCPTKVPETGRGRTVQIITGESLKDYFSPRASLLKGQSEKTLFELNASTGPATGGSKPDFFCTFELNSKLYGLAVGEFKDNTLSPLEQIGQTFASGCNIILSHLHLGLDREKCAVPLLMTNGNLYQFGWIALLEPSFPVLYITSEILDASAQSLVIAKHLAKMKIFCISNSAILTEAASVSQGQIPETKISLDNLGYHRKNLNAIFLRFGNDGLEKSLHYQWKVYQKLEDVDEAVKPLAFSNLKEKEKVETKELIFPMLTDFKMGVPSNDAEFNLFVENLKVAIRNIHGCGIVHIDLYPSNILWKFDDENVTIRIVDWDVATVIGDKFPPAILKRRDTTEVSQYYYIPAERAEVRCDYWFLYILSKLTGDEKKNMNGSIVNVNEVFRKSVDRMVEEVGGKANLVGNFEDWFRDQSKTPQDN
jgi:hypothetical protein